MAARLIGAGHRVRTWNRTPKALGGAEAAETLAATAEADIILTMLADDDAVRSTWHALAPSLRPGTVHVCMATVSVALVRELAPLHAERGVTFVSAPVLGRPDAAAAGKLNILASGPSDALDRVQPLFDAMGQKTWHSVKRPNRPTS